MKFRLFALFTLLLMVSACTTLTLSPANFAWPIETVLTTGSGGDVTEERYSFSFNASSLIKAEMGETASVEGITLRVIRDYEGYYFMIAEDFMYVYVFESKDGAFMQVNKIFISKEGINSPAFNQRTPYVELLSSGTALLLDKNGTKRN